MSHGGVDASGNVAPSMSSGSASAPPARHGGDHPRASRRDVLAHLEPLRRAEEQSADRPTHGIGRATMANLSGPPNF